MSDLHGLSRAEYGDCLRAVDAVMTAQFGDHWSGLMFSRRAPDGLVDQYKAVSSNYFPRFETRPGFCRWCGGQVNRKDGQPDRRARAHTLCADLARADRDVVLGRSTALACFEDDESPAGDDENA